MFPHIDNPFDARSKTRPPAKQDTAGFLDAIGDPEAAAAYRKAMGEEARPPTTEGEQEQELTPEELARLRAVEASLRETQEKKDLAALKAEYLAWAQEFGLGDDDPQGWIDNTFIFNPDGTVEVDGDLHIFYRFLSRLPPALTRVNGSLSLYRGLLTSLDGLPQEIYGDLNLSLNRLTSLESLPQEIHGDLLLDGNPFTSLEELRGKKIKRDLYLRSVGIKFIPRGISLGGDVVVKDDQRALEQDAISKGYTVRVSYS